MAEWAYLCLRIIVVFSLWSVHPSAHPSNPIKGIVTPCPMSMCVIASVYKWAWVSRTQCWRYKLITCSKLFYMSDTKRFTRSGQMGKCGHTSKALLQPLPRVRPSQGPAVNQSFIHGPSHCLLGQTTNIPHVHMFCSCSSTRSLCKRHPWSECKLLRSG